MTEDHAASFSAGLGQTNRSTSSVRNHLSTLSPAMSQTVSDGMLATDEDGPAALGGSQLNNLVMLCPACHADAWRRGRSQVAQVYKENLVFIKNVPARVCSQCGHSEITARTAKRLENLIDHGDFTGITPAYTFDLSTPKRSATESVSDKTEIVALAIASTQLASIHA